MPKREVSMLYNTMWKEFHASDVSGDIFHSFEWITTSVSSEVWNTELSVELSG